MAVAVAGTSGPPRRSPDLRRCPRSRAARKRLPGDRRGGGRPGAPTFLLAVIPPLAPLPPSSRHPSHPSPPLPHSTRRNVPWEGRSLRGRSHAPRQRHQQSSSVKEFIPQLRYQRASPAGPTALAGLPARQSLLALTGLTLRVLMYLPPPPPAARLWYLKSNLSLRTMHTS